MSNPTALKSSGLPEGRSTYSEKLNVAASVQPEAIFDGLVVCVVGPHYPRPGGVSTQVEALENSLRAEGAVVRPVDTNVQQLRRAGRIGRWMLPLAQTVLAPLRLWRAATGADLIHAHLASDWGFYLPMLAVALVHWLRRVPALASYHGGKAGLFATRHSASVRALLRRLDALVVSSAFTGHVFESLGLHPVIIPNIVALDRYQPSPPGDGSQRLATPDRPALLWIKSFDEAGNPELMVEAFARLRCDLPGASLTMIGDGPRRAAAQSLAAELHAPVRFAGRVSFSALRQAYADADVLVISSAVDNQPNALVEASACGLPVVATAVGGIPDMVEDGVNALLVTPGDADALAAAVLRVTRDRELASRLGRAAVENAQNYTWPRVRSQIATLYAQVAGSI